MSLPVFSFDQVVTPETAKQDKIEVVYGPIKIRSTTEDIDRIREYIAIPPKDERDDPATSGAYGTLFLRPQEHANKRPPLKIRPAAVNISGRTEMQPLFSGAWAFTQYAKADSAEPVETTTRFNLHLNPTRYVRHQRMPEMPQMKRPREWPSKSLFAKAIKDCLRGEFSLDGNDNWLPNTPRRSAFTSPINWQRHLFSYFDGIPQLLGSHLSRVIEEFPSSDRWIGEHEAKFQLKSVETYFEFSSENPTLIVLGLKRLLTSFTRGHRETGEFERNTGEEITHNSYCLSAAINSGRKIRIYAKTNKRIRIEVVHTLVGSQNFRMNGGRTANDASSLLPLLAELAEDSAELVNSLLAHFRSLNSVEPSHISAFDLLTLICRNSADVPTAVTIASLLVTIGCIAGGKCPRAMSKSLYALRRLGILECSSRSVYTVAEPYRHAVRVLGRSGNLNTLVARERTR